MTTSARPDARGSNPASIPTQAAPSIWNGSHGPTPAVSSALANSVTAPSTKPNAASEDPTGDEEQEEDQLRSGGAAAERAQHGADGGEHAEQCHGLRVQAALGHLGQDDREQQREQQHEQPGRVAVVPESGARRRRTAARGRTTSPTTDVSATATADRGRSRSAGTSRTGSSLPRSLTRPPSRALPR